MLFVPSTRWTPGGTCVWFLKDKKGPCFMRFRPQRRGGTLSKASGAFPEDHLPSPLSSYQQECGGGLLGEGLESCRNTPGGGNSTPWPEAEKGKVFLKKWKKASSTADKVSGRVTGLTLETQVTEGFV